MKEMDEVQQFAEELEDEEFMDDLEEYDEEIEDEEDTELKISDLTEEELQALQLLQELASVSEKLWNAHIAKLLEYNKTHEVKMKEETVTIEDGETYIVYSAYLPDEKEEDGIWVPVRAIPVEDENVKSRRGPRSLAKPTFWKYIKKPANVEARKRLEEQIDPKLICPMNAVVSVFDEMEERSSKKRTKTIPMEEFFAPVKGRAESRHTQKIREYAERLNAIITRNRIEQAKNPYKKSKDTYVLLVEEIKEIQKDMKKSIRKMNQKTMSQSIKLAMGCGERVTPEVKKTYSRVGKHILKLLYDYDEDLFLSCFKRSDDGKEDMTGTDADGR